MTLLLCHLLLGLTPLNSPAMDAANDAHNAQLPSFVELMASLGLQDEHSAHALLRGASLTESSDFNTEKRTDLAGNDEQSVYRSMSNSSTHSLHELPTPTLEEAHHAQSLGTPLSSNSLVTPLSSPPVQRDHHRNSHGKTNRYSPYGLSAPVEDRDIYTRRGSVPGTTTDFQELVHDKRQLHHMSAPLQVKPHRFSQPDAAKPHERRRTDEDGDEMMDDADNDRNVLPTHLPLARPAQPQSHCAGQPNLLISRNVRGGLGQRTKSQTHLRTTSTGFSASTIANVPPIPSSDRTTLTQGRKNVSPYSSVGRRAGRAISTGSNHNLSATGSFVDVASAFDGDVDVSNSGTVVSISSLARRSQPPVAISTVGGDIGSVPHSPTTTTNNNAPAQPFPPPRTTSLKAPPSAPPTKTVFGFGPGVNISGASVNSGIRRARHARSNSARSVRDMIREREQFASTTKLHSFLPLTDEVELPPKQQANPAPLAKPLEPATTNIASSFLPLDDASRSFSQRRRNAKRHANRSSPPPPLMLLPTLPLNFSIKTIVGTHASSGDERSTSEDRLSAPDNGYVSRREPHSPDARSSWRTRRTTPPSGAHTPTSMRCGVPLGVTPPLPVTES